MSNRVGKVGMMGVVAWFDSQGIYFVPEEEEGRGGERGRGLLRCRDSGTTSPRCGVGMAD